ncbi:MAG TPA: polysaccharide deacetylase family protein [Candidatus Saccharimonadales bacterium]|nr:polysaccharide deacetylase family protein [Candidatus Saccharimonadales bacterium]
MRASAESLYPDLPSPLPPINTVHVFLPTEVTLYNFYQYAAYVPGPVNCEIEACIALTFDDGPNPLTTPKILDALEGVHAQATFFVIGNRVAPNQLLLKRMQTDGDEVGNHSWSHPDFTRLTVPEIQDQISKTQAAVVTAGLPAPQYFRPPYESRNHLVHQAVNMPFILWNVDPKDWARKSADDITANTIATVKPGSVIIFHDSLSQTVEALPKILNELKGHYHFVTINQLAGGPITGQVEYFGKYLPE